MAVLVACLVALRDEFNRESPARDKSSDGWIGDAAHRDRSSSHNPDESGVTPYEDADSIDEVHAIDVDATGPWPTGKTMQSYCDTIRLNHQRGDDDRLQNIIYDGRIASRSWGWTWREYTGSNPHDKHAHFESRYTTFVENDTSDWGVNDMNAAQMTAWLNSTAVENKFRALVSEAVDAEMHKRGWASENPISRDGALQSTYGKVNAVADEIADVKSRIADNTVALAQLLARD